MSVSRTTPAESGFDAFGRAVLSGCLMVLAWWLSFVSDLTTMDGDSGRPVGIALAVVALPLAWPVWRLIETRTLRVLVTALIVLPASIVGLSHVVGLLS